MKKRTIIIFLVTIIAISILSGCSQTTSGSDQNNSDSIKLGVAAPFTGDNAQFGDYVKLGVELAVEEINADGGVLGKTIELVYGDDKGDSKEAVSVAQKFASDSSITGIIGHFSSGPTLAAGPIYQQAGIPTIAVASTNPAVTEIGDYVYRTNIGDDLQGAQLAEIVKRKGYSKVSVIYDNSDYGKGVANVFVDKFTELGGEILINESYIGSQDKDFSLILTNIKDSETEAIVMASYYTEAALIIQQARNLGIDVPFYASDSLYTEDFINLAGEDAEGIYVVCYFHESDPSPSVQNFVKKFEDRYNKKIDAWSPYAYDAIYLMVDAIERAGSTDRELIKEAIASTSNFEGVTGNITYEGGLREPVGKDLLLLTVKDGEYIVAE